MAAAGKEKTLRPCCRRVSITVSIVSTKRLPLAALRPKGELPSDHRMTQRPLARVVRRFDPFVAQERPRPSLASNRRMMAWASGDWWAMIPSVVATSMPYVVPHNPRLSPDQFFRKIAEFSTIAER
jgi:hypothetical protein